MHKRRRMDIILDDDYLSGVDDLDLAAVRTMRDECEREEAGVSYARRLVQGKIDIVEAEVARRRGGDNAEHVLDHLHEVLADRGTRGPGSGRVTHYLVPPEAQGQRRWLDGVVNDDALAAIEERTDDDLSELVQVLVGKEQQLSQTRRALLDRIDALQNALTARYLSDGVDVSEILARRI